MVHTHAQEGDVPVLWNQAVHTDTEVTANRPDIIIKNNKEKTWILIDVAIPADRNVVQKEAEKNLKYKSLYTGCHRRNGPNFRRVFLMLNYTDITQNTYIQS